MGKKMVIYKQLQVPPVEKQSYRVDEGGCGDTLVEMALSTSRYSIRNCYNKKGSSNEIYIYIHV
jgi:hypothetical protein